MATRDRFSAVRWSEMAHRANYRASDLARIAGLCPRQLRRHTRATFNQSPQAWLDQERLKIALGLLRRRERIKTVAIVLGFKQVSHFSREFKKFYGLPPVEFSRWLETVPPVKKSVPDNPFLLSNPAPSNKVAAIPGPVVP